MANPINNVTLAGTTYSDAATISGVLGGRGGRFGFTGGDVFMQVEYGTHGQLAWTNEEQVGSGAGTVDAGATGVRFRNADAANPATITSARITPPSQPGFTINSVGTIAAAASSMITGIIPAAGTTPTAGTGFTYTHTNGTGVYVFTFTSPFAATPIVLAQPVSLNRIAFITSVSNGGFTATIWNVSTLGLADTVLQFTAQSVA